MKITDVEVMVLRLKGEIKLQADSTQDALIVRVHTDAGVSGIGEVDSSPYVVRAAIEAPISHAVCHGLREVLIGEDPLEIERLWQKMYDKSNWFGLRGAAIHAMSGIDIALWDIFGKVTGQPIYKLLGGAFRKKIRAYSSALFPPSPAEIADLAKRNVDDGFTAMKFGWNQFGQDEKHDLALIEAARKAVGPDVDIMVDAGLCYKDASSAIRMARRLEDYDVFWFEEPLSSDDIAGYARLSEAVDIKIASGERIETRFAFRELIEQGKVDIIQPDVTRAGGLSECRKIALIADLNHRLTVPHGWSTDILLAATLHLNASMPNGMLLEFCIQESPLRQNLVKEPFVLEDGYVRVPEKPGLGIELNDEVVNEYRIH